MYTSVRYQESETTSSPLVRKVLGVCAELAITMSWEKIASKRKLIVSCIVEGMMVGKAMLASVDNVLRNFVRDVDRVQSWDVRVVW